MLRFRGHPRSLLSKQGVALWRQVKAIFAKPGIEAHLYLPGVSPSQGFIPGNYIDSAGTQPAVYDQPVGLVLDAAGSVWTNICTGSPAYGNSSTAPATEPFAITSVAAGNAIISWPAPAVGKTHRLRFSWSNNTSNKLVQFSVGNVYFSAGTATAGSFEYVATPTAIDNINLYILATAAGQTITFNSVVCTELTGIHASQQTVGYKPIERRGIVNLLTYSNDLTNAAWSKRGTVVITPNHSQGLARVSGIDASGVGDVYEIQSSGYTDLVAYSPALILAQDPACPVGVIQVANPQNSARGQWLVNLALIPTTPTLITKAHPAVTVSSEFSGSGTGGGVHILKSSGTGSLSVLVGTVGTFAGTLTAAQIIAAGGIPLTTTAPASSSAGNAYLEFVALNANRLQLSSAPFQMSDDHCVVAGVSIPAGTGDYTFFEVGDASTANRVASMRLNSGQFNTLWKNGAQVNQAFTGAAVPTGVPFVATARKAGSVCMSRRNGGNQTSSSNAIANFAAPSANIGSRTTNEEFLKGSLFAVLVIKGTVSDADLAVLEKFVAQLSGVTL